MGPYIAILCLICGGLLAWFFYKGLMKDREDRSKGRK